MITEATMTQEDMQKAVDNGYLCAKCQGKIVVAWGGGHGYNGYILRCGNDIEHEGITRHDKKYEQKLKEGFSMDSNTLMTMAEAKMLQRVEMARFPQDLTVAEKKLLAQVAITYGFDPLMGEISIYQGRPYVSIDGRYRKAQETGHLDGVETRPATKQEKDDWKIPEGDYFFRSEVYVKGSNRPFVAWGRVHKAETIGGKGYKPVEKNPQRMAEKRAEAQALRKAFHIPLPSVEDIGSPDYDVDSTAVDITTGEITGGKAGKPEPKAKPELSSDAPPATPSPVAETPNDNLPEEATDVVESPGAVDGGKLKRDPKTLKSIPDMFKASHADFGLQPKDVMSELNITNWSELAITPAEAYIQIASVRRSKNVKTNRD